MALLKRLLISLLALRVRVALADDDNFVFTENLLHLAEMSAELNYYWGDTSVEEYGFENYTTYQSSPYYSFFALREGYCFVAFSSLDITSFQDIYTVFEPGAQDICNNPPNPVDGTNEMCCSAKKGFVGAYYINDYQDFEGQIRECADQCEDPDECVVITGYSKGSAVAAVAAVALADLNPYLFLFGQFPAIYPPCPLINSDRWFSFVNAYGATSVNYDPVPFSFELGSGAMTFGHMIVLGNDPSAVAYIGLDYTGILSPLQFTGRPENPPAHRIQLYLDRLQTLVEYIHDSPVQLGFNNSYPCTEDRECISKYCARDAGANFTSCSDPKKCKQDEDCDSGLCVIGTCSKLLQESCMSCNQDSDCDSGKCWYSYCTGSNGLMDDNCACFYNSDCTSGQCSWSFTCESSST